MFAGNEIRSAFPGADAVPLQRATPELETARAGSVDEQQLLHDMLGRLVADQSDPTRAAFSYIARGGRLLDERIHHEDTAVIGDAQRPDRVPPHGTDTSEQLPSWGKLELEDFLEIYFGLMDVVSKRATRSGLNPFRTDTYRELDEAECALEPSNWQEVLYRRGYWPDDIEDFALWRSITMHQGVIGQILYDASVPYDDLEEDRAHALYRTHQALAQSYE